MDGVNCKVLIKRRCYKRPAKDDAYREGTTMNVRGRHCSLLFISWKSDFVDIVGAMSGPDLPALFIELNDNGQKGEFNKAVKVADKSKLLKCSLMNVPQLFL